jgi:hypothetical protein
MRVSACWRAGSRSLVPSGMTQSKDSKGGICAMMLDARGNQHRSQCRLSVGDRLPSLATAGKRIYAC